jgi:hypothetical protein
MRIDAGGRHEYATDGFHFNVSLDFVIGHCKD